MNIASIVGQIVPKLLAGAEDGPLGNIFELIGIQNPEALGEMGTGPGSIISALLESVGLGSEVADIVGIATDAYTGNIPGAVSGGAELLGGDAGGVTDFLSFASSIKM